MEIFNIKIWGEDADKFMAMSCDKKKAYIKKHTNQRNDALIEQFVKTVQRGVDGECEGCKEKKLQAPAAATHTAPKQTAKGKK